MPTAKKEAMNMKGNGIACQYCGSTNCKCTQMEMLLWGVIALVLGILLSIEKLSLEMTIAIAFILKGLFYLLKGAKMKR